MVVKLGEGYFRFMAICNMKRAGDTIVKINRTGWGKAMLRSSH